MTDKLRDAEREAFEHALASKPDARFWNTADAMFWAWQARAALAHQDAQNAADEVWRKLFWQAALKLKCLPSSYPDANGHVLRAIDRLMGSENAQQDAQKKHKPLFAEMIAQHPGLAEELAQQDAQAELPIIRQNKLLADTLASCILASGIVRKDIDGLTGPQLLLFAEDLREMLETKTAQQDTQAVPLRSASRLQHILLFLLGEGDLHGYSFGEHKDGQGQYWWRVHLREAMLNAAPTPPAQQDAQAATCKQCLQVDALLDEMLDTLPYNSPDYWIGRIREVRYGAPTPPARATLTASEILSMMPESIPVEHDGALLEYDRVVIEAYERKNGKEAP